MGLIRDKLVKVEEHVDQITHRARHYDGSVFVDTYEGHGASGQALLRGRVVENLPIRSTPDQSALKNARDMIQRYASKEVPGAQLAVTLGDTRQEVETNREGYYFCRMPFVASGQGGSLWSTLDVELLSPLGSEQQQVHFTSHVQVPDERAEFGVICDIDDTVIETRAQSLVAHAKTVLSHNAYTRHVFGGMPEFLSALAERRRVAINPLFFLSSSPWNLHRLFQKIFEINGVPRGTFFLKDYGLEREHFLKSDHTNYKSEHAERLMATYPKMNFVLIGDSGQQDVEVYTDLLRDYPDRIKACYIRDVSNDMRRGEIAKVFADLHRDDVNDVAVLCKDSVQMAAHAFSIGLINEQDLKRIERASRAKRLPRSEEP